MAGAANKNVSSSSSSSSADGSSDAVEVVDKKTETSRIFDVRYDEDIIRTTVTHKASAVDEWIKDVDESFADEIKSGDFVVGFDVEWVRTSESSPERNPVAVLQLCLADRCLIFQLLLADKIPDSLFSFLEDENIIFVGVRIDKKAHMLWVDHKLYIERSEDLGALAEYKMGRRGQSGPFYKMGLRNLFGEVLQGDIPKPKGMTLSTWDIGDRFYQENKVEKGTLSDKQVVHACLDAYAAFRLGMHLINLAVPQKAEQKRSGKNFKKLSQDKGTIATNQEEGASKWTNQEKSTKVQGAKAPNHDASTKWTNQVQGPKAPNQDATAKTGTNNKVRQPRNEDEDYSVRVKFLSDDTQDDVRELEADFHKLFSPYGNLRRVRFPVDRDTGKSRGFGFVEFENEKDAEKAIDDLTGYRYDHRYIRVDWASREPRNEDWPVRVNNLSYDYTSKNDLRRVEADLRYEFGKYGAIGRVTVPTDKETGKSRGFAFVNFLREDAAAEAIENLDGEGYDHRHLRVGWGTHKAN